MKKQRSKAELLAHMRTYAALKKEERDGTELNKKVSYWRMGVEWSSVLWKEEKWSANEIAKLLQYVNSHDVTDLPEERREEIMEMLGDRVDWTLRNCINRDKKCKNAVDQAINDLAYYNTKTSVDYSLLACEYLITCKGYGKKRLNRVIGCVRYADMQEAQIVMWLRQDLYENKGIWIELDGDTPEDHADMESARTI